MIDQRPWNTDRALRVVLFEYYTDAPEFYADTHARYAVEGYTKFERPEQFRKAKEK